MVSRFSTWLFQVNHWLSHLGWSDKPATAADVVQWYDMGLEPRDAAMRLMAQ